MQHCTLFRGGTLVSFDPPRVEEADLVVGDGRVVRRGPDLKPPQGAEVVDVRGRVLIPGLVNAHVDLAEAYARILPIQTADAAVGSFSEETDVCAAFAIGMEAVRSGTTTLFVRHRAPSCASGSLMRVRDVLATLGVRFAASYAVEDDDDAERLEAAIGEAKSAAAFGAAPRMRYLIGLGRLSRLSDATLAAVADVAKKARCPIHVSLGREPGVDAHAETERLCAAGFPLQNAVVEGGPLLDDADATLLRGHGATIVRTPQIGGGRAATWRRGDALGTGAGRPDLFEALRAMIATAGLEAPPSAEDALALLSGGSALAAKLFDVPIGGFDPGAPGDVAVLDYRAIAPLTDETAARHVVAAFSSSHVQHVLVDGRVVLRDRMFHRLEIGRLYRQLQRGAVDLVLRGSGAPYPGLDRERVEVARLEGDDDGPAARVRIPPEGPEDFEPLPPEAPPAEPWRIKGGDRGSDVDPFAKPAAPPRSLRTQPAVPPPKQKRAPKPAAPKPAAASKAKAPTDAPPTPDAPRASTPPETPPPPERRTPPPPEAPPSDPFGVGVS
jgi:cytosine/adenosine deaminase-related metal-dependent hydrolase